MTDHIDGLPRSTCWAASLFRSSLEPRINQLAILVDGPRQVTPLPVDFDVRLIDVPRSRLPGHAVVSVIGLQAREQTALPHLEPLRV